MMKFPTGMLVAATLLALLAACDSSEKTKPSDVAQIPETSVEQAPQPSQGLATAAPDGALSAAIGGYCSLDAVNGNAVVGGRVELKRGAAVVLGGWATELAGTVPAKPMLIVHNGAGIYAVQLATGVSRPDVAAALKNPAFANAGYESPAMLKDVPAGTYDLSVLTPGDVPHRCPLNVVLTLAD